ncbi:MAG TPA: ABC transporter substrate-binding protein [Verrucomicrobiota bacterium]|nr:ABC transporter substrate-binding protein [Verrucomicrobiota bacterium]HNU52045.1 ABC transporter substrate-binding protein [Verrucomicrobiota bacterium]
MKLSALLRVLLGIGGFGGLPVALGAETGAPPAAEVPTLRIGHVGHDHHLALYVAALESESRKAAWRIHLETLKPREVYALVAGDRVLARLHLIPTEGGSGMPAALSRGEFDLGLGSTIAVAKLADSGQPLKIIAPLQTDGDELVVRKGSPITTWQALVTAARGDGRPLKIGYKEPMAVAKMILERALKAESIPYGYGRSGEERVVLVNFGSEKSPLPLLESGALDGFVMNQPGPALAVHKGLAQVVAELRDLPPAGRWAYHPCCCVAATEKAIEAHGDRIQWVLKLLMLATRLIHEDPALAIDCAVRWTKNPEAVEARSVPTVTYLMEPTDRWIAGMRTWHEMAGEVGFFKGKYATLSPEAFARDLCALDRCRAALREIAGDRRDQHP